MANTKVPIELSSTPGIVDNSNATAITIDSAGNVGIGTSNPTAYGATGTTLEVKGVSGSGSGLIKVTGADGVVSGALYAGGSTTMNIGTQTNHAFAFNTNNTERMRIDASGNLGIGVVPNGTYSKLQVKAAATSYVADFIGNASGDSQLTFWNSNQTAVVSYIENQTAGAHMSIVAGSGRSLKLGAGGTAGQVLLDASGKLSINTTSATAAYLKAAGVYGASYAASFLTNSANSSAVVVFENTNGIVGNIGTSGSSTSYNTSSDYRLKEDDVPMTGATERVKALRPINFAWKVDGSRTDGFFAHEAQEVVPECSTGTKDAMRDEEYEVTPAVEEVRDEDDNIITEAVAAVMGTRSVPDYQGIDQSKLVPLLTATIQELIARIEALEGA